MHKLAILLLISFSAAPSFASDGVFEINQTCAEQTGCFPGDTPGFPVTITLPGSYQLTSNLDILSVASLSGIRVEARASIDLGGFRIKTETAGGGGSAIQGLAPTEVTNGALEFTAVAPTNRPFLDLSSDSSIRDLYVNYPSETGGIAVGCGSRCLIENLRLTVGIAHGLSCGNDCIVSKVAVSVSSAGDAIICGEGCLVEKVTTQGGISAGASTHLKNVRIGGVGFFVYLQLGNQSIIDGCSVAVDLSSGTSPTCGQGCSISRSTFSASGSAGGSSERLMIVGAGSVIRESAFRGSSGVALEATGDVGYAGNVFTGNNGGNANPQVQGGTDLGGNLCGQRLTCP